VVTQTSRFGQVQFQEEDILNFPEGILGFGELKRFVLVDDPTDEIFAWLQACDEASIAFPVLEPELFTENYKVTLSKTDMESIKIPAGGKYRLFSIVTIPDDPTKMTANLKAPVVVNVAERLARQCVLQDNNLAIREPIFHKLQQRVVAHPGKSIKSQSAGLEVAVRLPNSPASEPQAEGSL